VRVIAFMEAGVVQNDFCLSAFRLEFKFYNRVLTRFPGGGPPRLHNPLAGDQFNVSSLNHSSEHGERASGLAADLGSRPGESGELFGIEKNLVDTMRARFETHFLMEIGAGFIRPGALRFLHFLLRPDAG